MSLIERQVEAAQKENAINKRLTDNSYKAVKAAKKIKPTSRGSPKVVYGDLLDNIIKSNLKDQAINRRLEQISYSAIDGQRQTEGTYKPEGVQMLGQLGREKPLEAITKEMIKEYQEEDQKPYIIDGEARKYTKADYEPILQLPQSLDDIKDDMKIIYRNKVATAKTIKDAEEYLKTADEYYRGVIRDINVFGMTDAKRKEKEQTERHILQEKTKYDQLKNQMDRYEYELKRLFDEGKEIKRQNALIPEKNREEVAKYEQSLLQHNRNRLNLQQQPNESDIEYYQRLREVERTKMDPVLYKQYSINKVSKELKPKLGNLFKDEGQIEEVIKSLSENDKFIVNKNFDRVEKDFIDKYGYNPSMNTKMAVNAILEPFASTTTQIQALIKRKNAQDLYIPDLSKKQEEDREDATNKLQALFKRKRIQRKFPNVLNKYRENQDKQKLADMKAVRERQQQRMDDIRLGKEREYLDSRDMAVIQEQAQQALRSQQAATNIQRVLRGYTGRTIASREAVNQATQQALAQYATQQAKETLSSALSRSKLQPEVRQIIQENKAKETLSSAFLRSGLQPQVRKMIEKNKTKEAKKREREYMRIQEAYLQDIERRLPVLENWVGYHQEQQAREIEPQRELVNREISSNAASLIQKSFRGHQGRTAAQQEKTNKLIQQSIDTNAASLIQNVFRGHQGRTAARQERQAAIEDENRKRISAKLISDVFQRSLEKQQQSQAATLIQKRLRGNQGRTAARQERQAQEQAAQIIQQSLQGTKNKAKIMQAVRREIAERKPIYVSSPSALSGATTLPQQQRELQEDQEKAGLRKTRSDLGSKRGSYKKKNKEAEQLQQGLKPGEQRLLQEQKRAQAPAQSQTRAQAREQRLSSILQRPGNRRLQDIGEELEAMEDEPMAKTSAPRKGKGLKKPPRRKAKANPEEKKKDRLRLVVSQIKAGNTNPKLIVEVNKLYKDLYDIDNAHMMLK